MKKISLLSMFGLSSFFLFLAIPSNAQELDEGEDVVEAVVDLTDTSSVDEDIYNADYAPEDDAYAPVEETVVDDVDSDDEDISAEGSSFLDQIAADPEAVESLNDTMDQIFTEVGDEELEASFNNLFQSREERAQAIAALGAMFLGLGLTGLVIGLVALLIYIVAGWIIFNKAGEKGWKILIPIYNYYIFCKIAGYKSFFWWSMLIPIVLGLIAGFIPEYEEILSAISGIICCVFGIILNFEIARKFGWGVFTSILYVIFTPICMLILAFGGSKYLGNSNSTDETIVEA